MKKLIVLLTALFAANTILAAYSISEAGIVHIKNFETCKLTAYYDADGYSIGWGHHSKDVRKGQKITQAKADKYLKDDLRDAEKMTNYLLDKLPYKYTFSQGFIDGMVSLVFNAGVGNIQNSTFYSRLKRCRVSKGKMNTDDFNFTIAAVKSTCISEKGHKNRRAAEMDMMSR